MNFVSMMGFLLCFAILLLGVVTNGGIGTLLNFIHIPSALITFGGAFLAALASADSLSDYMKGLKSFSETFKKQKMTTDEAGSRILDLAELARREGLLALEEKTDGMTDEFMKKGLRLIIDGTAPELVRDILEEDMNHQEDENLMKIQFWEDLGAYGPAWGMIGTLLGLINMLQSMGSDPGGVGAGMSVALITTLYGSILANWICAPVARRLRKNNNNEMLLLELKIEGILSVQAGENPKVIREKISTFLTKKEENGEPEKKAA